MRTSEFQYDLPRTAIAQEPIEPRHRARLLDTRDRTDHTFQELPSLLRPGDLVVVNRTRVRKARLRGKKRGSGGRVELLMLGRDGAHWRALVRPARKVRPGTVIEIEELTATILAGPHEGMARVSLAAPNGSDPEEHIERLGEVPLPPYFQGRLADPERYQTMFAKALGSAAAPTAGLHFTPEVFRGLGDRGVVVCEIELSVGLDTFRPISSSRIEDHRIHSEEYSIPPEAAAAVAHTREREGRVVAVGTTVVRALESAASGGGVRPGPGTSELFITPGYRFSVVDLLVTNFHVPGSSLVVLVAAFMGPAWREAYRLALERGYRFLSFGDAMLAGPNR